MIIKKIKVLLRYYPRHINIKNDLLLIKNNKKNSVKNNRNLNIKVVLIESNDQILYSKLFLKLINSLREKTCVDCYFANILGYNSITHNRKLSLLQAYIKSLIINLQWARIYKLHSIKQGFSFNSLNLYDYPRYIGLAFTLWKNAKLKFDKDFKILGIKVGDLIIDTYLRYKPHHKFIINDFFTWYLFFISIVYINRSKKFFDDIKPDIYLASYSSYLHHGIPIRLALHYGLEVRLFSNPRNFAKLVSVEYPYHTDSGIGYLNLAFNNYHLYKNSEANLLDRISGKIDNSIIYMKQSAYNSKIKTKIVEKVDYVIFLHSFTDNVHCYPNFIFSDFTEWLDYTVLTLKKLNIKFMIKPHPNETSNGKHVIMYLKNIYGENLFLPDTYDNKKLIDHGIKLGITAYGTISHELAFLGIPSISCSHNPHFEFSFNHIAKNLQEYTSYLDNLRKLKFNKENLKKEACMFYISHNLVKNSADIYLENLYIQLHKKSLDLDFKNFDYLFSLIEESESYQKLINSLVCDNY